MTLYNRNGMLNKIYNAHKKSNSKQKSTFIIVAAIICSNTILVLETNSARLATSQSVSKINVPKIQIEPNLANGGETFNIENLRTGIPHLECVEIKTKGAKEKDFIQVERLSNTLEIAKYITISIERKVYSKLDLITLNLESRCALLQKELTNIAFNQDAPGSPLNNSEYRQEPYAVGNDQVLVYELTYTLMFPPSMVMSSHKGKLKSTILFSLKSEPS